MEDKIIQVSGFGTQSDYLLVALTETGKVLLSTGDRKWADVSPEEPTTKCIYCDSWKEIRELNYCAVCGRRLHVT